MDNAEIAVYFSTFHSPPLIHFSNFQRSKAQSAFGLVGPPVRLSSRPKPSEVAWRLAISSQPSAISPSGITHSVFADLGPLTTNY